MIRVQCLRSLLTRGILDTFLEVRPVREGMRVFAYDCVIRFCNLDRNNIRQLDPLLPFASRLSPLSFALPSIYGYVSN